MDGLPSLHRIPPAVTVFAAAAVDRKAKKHYRYYQQRLKDSAVSDWTHIPVHYYQYDLHFVGKNYAAVTSDR
jgi:hypothetical protein